MQCHVDSQINYNNSAKKIIKKLKKLLSIKNNFYRPWFFAQGEVKNQKNYKTEKFISQKKNSKILNRQTF